LARGIRRLTEAELVNLNLKTSTKYRDRIKIISVTLPNIINGLECTIEVAIEGTIKKGFLDVLIKDSNYHWFPDYTSFDENKNLGTLDILNQRSVHKWTFKPDSLQKKFKTFIFIFEDTDGNSADNRKVVDGIEVLQFS
jgi:hypothetical protein